MNNAHTELEQTFFVFRHGLAKKGTSGYGEEILTAGLLKEGEPAVYDLAKYLKTVQPQKLLTSTVPRCVDTAQIVSQVLGIEMIPDSRLNEYHQESFADFIARVNDIYNELTTYPEKKIAIATHGAVMAALSHLITQRQVTEFDMCDYTSPAGLRILTKNSFEQISFFGYFLNGPH